MVTVATNPDLYGDMTPPLSLVPMQEEASAASAPPSDGVELPDDIANRMSLFYANPTPMLNTLSGAAEKLLQEVCVWVCVCGGGWGYVCWGVGVWVWVDG